MRNAVIPAIALYSVLALLIATIMVVVGDDSLMGVGAEGFSRLGSNLALLAFAMGVWVRKW